MNNNIIIHYYFVNFRMLCQQLTTIMDNYSELSLDIPESEPCLTGMELFSDEASLSILIPKKRKFAEAKLSAVYFFLKILLSCYDSIFLINIFFIKYYFKKYFIKLS